MLARWQPFADVRSEMNRLHQEMNRLFGRYTNGAREFSPGGYPPLNVWEQEDHLYVEAELPGFSLDNLEILVTGDNQLNIRGERKPPELENGAWHRQERGYGSFSRLMELPIAVHGDQVSAEFENGVLTIKFAKKAEAKPWRIEVKTG